MNIGGGGQSTYIEVSGIASVLVVAAPDTALVVDLPTVGSWFSKNWYVIFVIALFLVACIASMIVSLVRWSVRRKHRVQREEKKKKDVFEGMRRVASSFRGGPSSTTASNAYREDADDVRSFRGGSSKNLSRKASSTNMSPTRGDAAKKGKPDSASSSRSTSVDISKRSSANKAHRRS